MRGYGKWNGRCNHVTNIHQFLLKLYTEMLQHEKDNAGVLFIFGYSIWAILQLAVISHALGKRSLSLGLIKHTKTYVHLCYHDVMLQSSSYHSTSTDHIDVNYGAAQLCYGVDCRILNNIFTLFFSMSCAKCCLTIFIPNSL